MPKVSHARLAIAGAATAAAMTIAGCGAGQITQTDTQVAAVDGAHATQGDLQIRNAALAYPPATGGQDAPYATYAAGADVVLEASIINEGTVPDRLVSASSPIATSRRIVGRADVPPGWSLVSTGDAAPGAMTATTGASRQPDLPRTARTTIVLTGLRYAVKPGLNYEVTLVFARAGEVRLLVPVANPVHPT